MSDLLITSPDFGLGFFVLGRKRKSPSNRPGKWGNVSKRSVVLWMKI